MAAKGLTIQIVAVFLGLLVQPLLGLSLWPGNFFVNAALQGSLEAVPFNGAARKEVSPSIILFTSGLAALPSSPRAAMQPQSLSLIKVHRVEKGETLSSIGKKYGIGADVIFGANPYVLSPAVIKAGAELLIPPAKGTIHAVKSGETLSSIAKRYKVKEGVIQSADGKALAQSNRSLESGELVFIPGIVPARPKTTVKSAQSKLPSLEGYFITPTSGYNWGRLHSNNGVDIASPCGMPVVASADGVVFSARNYGWNDGAGSYVLIQHPNNTQTLYGHMKELFVSTGREIRQGVAIGLVGNTGFVRGKTGCHLHFEVRGARNPLAKR